jgi:fructose transport system substrate-binding protein
VKAGKIDTDVMQFPSKMATKAIDLSIKAAHGKNIPSRVDTGEVLITTNPQDGVPSKGIDYGLKHCWGK